MSSHTRSLISRSFVAFSSFGEWRDVFDHALARPAVRCEEMSSLIYSAYSFGLCATDEEIQERFLLHLSLLDQVRAALNGTPEINLEEAVATQRLPDGRTFDYTKGDFFKELEKQLLSVVARHDFAHFRFPISPSVAERDPKDCLSEHETLSLDSLRRLLAFFDPREKPYNIPLRPLSIEKKNPDVHVNTIVFTMVEQMVRWLQDLLTTSEEVYFGKHLDNASDRIRAIFDEMRQFARQYEVTIVELLFRMQETDTLLRFRYVTNAQVEVLERLVLEEGNAAPFRRHIAQTVPELLATGRDIPNGASEFLLLSARRSYLVR